MLLQGPAHVHKADVTAASTAKPDLQPAEEAPLTGSDEQRETRGGPATTTAEHTSTPAAQPAASDHAATAPQTGQAAEQHSHGGLLAALASGGASASNIAPLQPGRLQAAQPQVCSAGISRWSGGKFARIAGPRTKQHWFKPQISAGTCTGQRCRSLVGPSLRTVPTGTGHGSMWACRVLPR